MLAAVTAALKDPAAKEAAAQEVLALLENLDSPSQAASEQAAPDLPAPENNTANTPATGAGGGGTPCTASCN